MFGVCVRVCMCVCINVCEYGFFTPSRTEGRGEAGWSSLFLPRAVAVVTRDTRRVTRVEEMLRSIKLLLRELRARSVLPRCDGRAFFSDGRRRRSLWLTDGATDDDPKKKKKTGVGSRRIDLVLSLRFSLNSASFPRDDRSFPPVTSFCIALGLVVENTFLLFEKTSSSSRAEEDRVMREIGLESFESTDARGRARVPEGWTLPVSRNSHEEGTRTDIAGG